MEFLLENPILIFILIGFISSLFKKDDNKKKKPVPKQKEKRREWQRPRPTPQQAKEQEPKPELKPVIDGPYVEPDIFKIPEIFMEEFNPNPKEKEYERKLEEVERKLLELEEKERLLKEREAEIYLKSRFVQNHQQTQTIPEQLQTSFNQSVNETKLADAVVWAEILGPPRAKKPYFSRLKSQ